MLNWIDEAKQIRIQKDEESFQRKLPSEKPQADDHSEDTEAQDQLFVDQNKVALQSKSKEREEEEKVASRGQQERP